MTARPTSMSARGDQTREALIDAAVEVFGRDGFRAASTRSIADTARVNQALIGYHFGGKPGLYVAVFDRIVRRVALYLDPIAEAVEQHLAALDEAPAAAKRQRAASLDLVHRLIDALVATFTMPESAAWARLILREQQNPSEAFDRLYGGAIGRILTLLSRLIGQIRDLDPDGVEARLLSQTIIGQALVFRSARATVQRHLGWQEVGADQIDLIRAMIRRNVTAMLSGGRS
jgi:TetR/AcrR family transcriptional regulator, regulator of cefoperazone and chloramphenicol sensitivity